MAGRPPASATTAAPAGAPTGHRGRARLPGPLRRRAHAWLRRRQGADSDPVTLERNRIYILPTRLGIAFAGMLFAMVVGGLNYDNNLGLGLAFLIGSIGVVAMHHCHGNLLGLQLRLAGTQPDFAGGRVVFGIQCTNASRSARPWIELHAAGSEPRGVDLPPADSAVVELTLPAPRRGLVRLDRCVVATRHPLGLFRAWAVLHPDYAALVYPAPAASGSAPPGVEADTGGAQDGAAGEDDFSGLKRFQPGDRLARVAWKTAARGHGLHTKQYAGTHVTTHVFDWDQAVARDPEQRLALLCRWILDAHAQGEAFGLRLPGQPHIEPGLGPAQRQRCLAALALFEPGAARG